MSPLKKKCEVILHCIYYKILVVSSQISSKIEKNYAYISFKSNFFLSDIESKLEFCQEGFWTTVFFVGGPYNFLVLNTVILSFYLATLAFFLK